jgi:UDP-N-acetylmuramyl pentapeptide phosphotransferase/UDP-N-acetylglucosamine-1-phosphate transferase
MSTENITNVKTILLKELGDLSYDEKKNLLDKTNISFINKQLEFLNKQSKRRKFFAFVWSILPVLFLIGLIGNYWELVSNYRYISSIIFFCWSVVFAFLSVIDYNNIKKRSFILSLLKEI